MLIKTLSKINILQSYEISNTFFLTNLSLWMYMNVDIPNSLDSWSF